MKILFAPQCTHNNKFVIDIYCISLKFAGHNADLFVLNFVVLVLSLPYIIPSSQYMLPIMLFIIHESWAKVIMLFYFVALPNDTIELLVMKLI